MRKTFFLIFAMFVALVSCEKEETVILNDNDVKASKMEQIGKLFESVARQPEVADDLIKTAEIMLYKNYQELLPISDESVSLRGKARGYAFGKMFEGLVRHPEAALFMDAIAEQFLGKYDSEIISDDLLEYTIIYASPFLIESIARQPEAIKYLNVFCKKYLNRALDDLIEKE